MEDQAISDDYDEVGEGEVEKDSSKLMNDLYDAIPAVYRSDNATLLTRLLDVALDHKLDFEASLLLHEVVSLSLRSPSDTPNFPFICRPIHANFFLDLYTQWSSSGSPNATFFRILISALEVSQDVRVWSTPALQSIAQIMYIQDFASYLRLISVSSIFAAEPCTTSVASQFEARKSLLSRISIWLKTILEQLTTIEHDPDGSVTAYSNDVGEMLTCVLSSVCGPKASQVPSGLEAEIQGITVSLSTQWLTVLSLPSESLVGKLSMTLPHVSTFTPLVEKVFLDSNGCLRVLRTAIQDIASTLYSLNLLHLHASLLGCTLRYIENSSHERELAAKNGVAEIQNYRHELIRLADEAEDRFIRPYESSVSKSFSERSHVIATPLRRELFRDISEWEPRSGSWIRKLEFGTSTKKRKVTHGRYLNASGHESRSTALKRDQVHMHPRVTRGREFWFSTLLSRAASKRVVLHPIQQLPYLPTESEEIGKTDEESGNISDDDCQPVFFSDDALNLFACTSTT
ncbi:hypothetical protein C0993_004453 [Termitomyces sp. T159_Od127]|nr:hypothetical protein C0993_004453 [Termitomyces sp. T159_Od127]